MCVSLGPFGDVQCVSADTHRPIWSRNIIREYEANLGNWGICQSPLVYKHLVIVGPLSKKTGIVAFDKATGKEVWKSENSTDFGHGLMCMDLAGEVKWRTSNENAEENGSVLIADGKIFSLLSETGVLRLVRASPDAHRQLASAPVCSGGNTWTPMAISEGKLLVRRGRTLICLDVSAQQ